MFSEQQLTSVVDHIAVPGVEKTIDPARHAMLDYGVAFTFFSLAARNWGHHRPAAALAILNGVMVLGTSLLTNYPGGIWKKISFPMHGAMHRKTDLLPDAARVVGEQRRAKDHHAIEDGKRGRGTMMTPVTRGQRKECERDAIVEHRVPGWINRLFHTRHGDVIDHGRQLLFTKHTNSPLAAAPSQERGRSAIASLCAR